MSLIWLNGVYRLQYALFKGLSIRQDILSNQTYNINLFSRRETDTRERAHVDSIVTSGRCIPQIDTRSKSKKTRAIDQVLG